MQLTDWPSEHNWILVAHHIENTNVVRATNSTDLPGARKHEVTKSAYDLISRPIHHRLPQLLLLADEFGCLSRRHRLCEGSEVRKLLPKFGVIEDGPQVLSHLAHYPIGCPGWREQREPTRCHESGNCFSYGRQIRKIRQPPRRGNRDRLERAPLNGAQQRS